MNKRVNWMGLLLGGLGLWLTMPLLQAAEKPGLRYINASAAIFNTPHDILLSPDGKRLYVSDNGNHRVAVLDPLSLELLEMIGEGELAEPHDVAIDGDGRLLVADTGNNRIAIFTQLSGGWRLEASLRERLRRPEGVCVHPDGRILAAGTGSGNLLVYRDGELVAERRGLASPHDVELDANLNIWVADTGRNRLLRLNQQLETVAQRSGPGLALNGPRYMDFDSLNRLYLADKYSDSVKLISPEGELLEVISEIRTERGKEPLDRPEGVEIRGRDLWISDTYNHRILRFRIGNDGE